MERGCELARILAGYFSKLVWTYYLAAGWTLQMKLAVETCTTVRPKWILPGHVGFWAGNWLVSSSFVHEWWNLPPPPPPPPPLGIQLLFWYLPLSWSVCQRPASFLAYYPRSCGSLQNLEGEERRDKRRAKIINYGLESLRRGGITLQSPQASLKKN